MKSQINQHLNIYSNVQSIEKRYKTYNNLILCIVYFDYKLKKRLYSDKFLINSS